ncbi:SpvB/TcaC N-terminal domain-containing protein, partial [Micromonospora chersina]|uniref:SpvB/TcaC N-terminal domain-containing protein n=1 Tax=Micromonospora chersina TaxID=47854 RepID=UPI0037BD6A8E
SSAGGNGWLGVGWDLATPAIMVDTRWGVPRYDAGKETETYLFNGQMLTPVSHRGPPVARSSGDKVFHTRVEGGFAKIVRKGTGPAGYSWEVTDKSGAVSTYGGAGAVLTDGAGRVFMWALREVRDLHGNFMTYGYTKVDDNGVGCSSGCEAGSNLYLDKITYTGSGSSAGRYTVTFVRDRQIAGEALRTDKTIDARGGFKRVTADRLRKVEVRFDNALVRRYELSYTTGAFGKTLLTKIVQTDSGGAEFTKHEFSYFDEVRDDQGVYDGFDPKSWTVPDDGLTDTALKVIGTIALEPGAGDGSVLGSSKSKTEGEHVYVGGGTSKGTSAGNKVGHSETSNDGVLALVDVDGDNLPDKVFRSAGVVKYRKNLSKPGGQLAFDATARELTRSGGAALADGFMSERSESWTVGEEGYFSGLAGQLDFTTTTATTDRYFLDVNGDGITDLVNGTSVLFGRLGTGGVPVYGVSADTPAPITSGTVDTSKLFPDFGAEQGRLQTSFPMLDSVRRWVAPYDGVVTIEGAVRLDPATVTARAASQTADGVRYSIQKENTLLWSESIGKDDNAQHFPGGGAGLTPVSVKKGDRLYFRVESLTDGSLDAVLWNPKIRYGGLPVTRDVNALLDYEFEAAREFTLGGRDTEVKAPLTGTLHLSGDVRKAPVSLSDDLTAVITRDGVPVVEVPIDREEGDVTAVSADVAVQQGQVLKWRLRTDSSIDLGSVTWTPKAVYTAVQGVDRVVDGDGNPLFSFFPAYDVDMYPVNGLSVPQQPYMVPEGGGVSHDVVVRPSLSFNFGSAKPSGRVVFTAKNVGELRGKAVFTITDGVVTSPAAMSVPSLTGQGLFFDFSTNDPGLRQFLTGFSVAVDVDGGPDTSNAPAAFHTPAPADGGFPQAFRGWSVIGYRGNQATPGDPIVPINQSDLVIDAAYADQFPDSVDPTDPAQRDGFEDDPQVTAPKAVAFVAQPQFNRWGVSDNSWVSGTGASSSRMGAPSVSLPGAGAFNDATAVSRISKSRTLSATGGVGVPGGSVGVGVGTGDST